MRQQLVKRSVSYGWRKARISSVISNLRGNKLGFHFGRLGENAVHAGVH